MKIKRINSIFTFLIIVSFFAFTPITLAAEKTCYEKSIGNVACQKRDKSMLENYMKCEFSLYYDGTSDCETSATNFCNGHPLVCAYSCTPDGSSESHWYYSKDTAITYLTNYCNTISTNGDNNANLTNYKNSVKAEYEKDKSKDCTSILKSVCNDSNENCTVYSNSGNKTEYDTLLTYCNTLKYNDTDSGKVDQQKTAALEALKSDLDTKYDFNVSCDTTVSNVCATHQNGCTFYYKDESNGNIDDKYTTDLTNDLLTYCNDKKAKDASKNSSDNSTGTAEADPFGTLTCSDIQSILDFFNGLYFDLEIAAIVILVVMTMFDYIKVVTGDGEKDADILKKAQKNMGTRIIIAAIIILLPIIVKLLLSNLPGVSCSLN
jgi:hypothetical protein